MGILGDIVKRSASDMIRKEDQLLYKEETKEELFDSVHEGIIKPAESGVFHIKVVTDTIKDIEGLFAECSSLKSVVLKEWHIPKVRSMRALFDGCENLESVRFQDCDFSEVEDMRDMFCRCTNLKRVTGLVVSDNANLEGLFDECPVKFCKDGNKIVIIDEKDCHDVSCPS